MKININELVGYEVQKKIKKIRGVETEIEVQVPIYKVVTRDMTKEEEQEYLKEINEVRGEEK